MRKLTYSFEELKQLFNKQLQHQDGIELFYVKRLTEDCYGVLEQGLTRYMYFHIKEGIFVVHYINDMISAEYNIVSIHENSLHKVTPYEITLCRTKLVDLEENLKIKKERYVHLEEELAKKRLEPVIEELEGEIFKWRYILKQARQDLAKSKPLIQEKKTIVNQA